MILFCASDIDSSCVIDQHNLAFKYFVFGQIFCLKCTLHSMLLKDALSGISWQDVLIYYLFCNILWHSFCCSGHFKYHSMMHFWIRRHLVRSETLPESWNPKRILHVEIPSSLATDRGFISWAISIFVFWGNIALTASIERMQVLRVKGFSLYIGKNQCRC